MNSFFFHISIITKKNEDITEGEFVINLILIIFLFFPVLISSYNLWDMKQ